jgi:ABC-type Mn2+/Zn2+ transport system permease subunit
LTFLNLGLLKIKHDLVYKKWLLPSHFISCLMFTSIAIGFMLSFDQWIATILGGFIILVLNYGVLSFFTRKYQKKQTPITKA